MELRDKGGEGQGKVLMLSLSLSSTGKEGSAAQTFGFEFKSF